MKKTKKNHRLDNRAASKSIRIRPVSLAILINGQHLRNHNNTRVTQCFWDVIPSELLGTLLIAPHQRDDRHCYDATLNALGVDERKKR